MAAPTNVRRSITESPWRRLEVRPYYACRKASPASASIRCSDKRQSTTAIEREALWTAVGRKGPVTKDNSRPDADIRRGRKRSLNPTEADVETPSETSNQASLEAGALCFLRKLCPVITCWVRSARHFGVGDASQKCHMAINVRSLPEEAGCWCNDLQKLQSGLC